MTIEEHEIGTGRGSIVMKGTPLVDLLEDAEIHPSNSQDIFEAFLKEMAQEGRFIPPISLPKLSV